MSASDGLALAGFLAVAAGIAVLRFAWRRRERWHAAAVAGGWAVLAVAVLLYASSVGAEVGPAVAATAFCISGIAAAALGLQIRAPRTAGPREQFIDPSENPSHIGRDIIRTLTTCVLTLAAALCIGLAFNACAPMATPNAVVFGVFATLVAWSGLAVWAVTDRNVARTAAVLVVIAALAYALATTPGVCG
jgi:hypothetical protein